METSGELTAYDPPRQIAWRSTSGPFPMSGSTSLEAFEGCTRASDTIEAETGGFFKLAGPLLNKQIRGQTEKDMQRLKEILEK